MQDLDATSIASNTLLDREAVGSTGSRDSFGLRTVDLPGDEGVSHPIAIPVIRVEVNPMCLLLFFIRPIIMCRYFFKN